MQLLEEIFFRGFLQHTLNALLVGNKLEMGYGVLSPLLANGAFALFHYAVYGAVPTAILGAFIFGMIASLGNSYAKSLGFGLGAHFFINLVNG